MATSNATRYRIFAAVTPGLEDLLVTELTALDLAGATIVRGGVELAGGPEVLWRLALQSRLAESLRVRVGRSFAATSFAQLEQRVERLPWAAYIARGAAVPRMQVTCHRSRLYHTGAVAQRVQRVVARRLELCADPTDGEQATIFARIVRDQVQLAVDASGELLHRRGYRTHVGLAPLRETLAAACLAAAGFDGTRPLWDPFCGSGTLLLEAQSMACGVLPGALREFAFQRWPVHQADAFAAHRVGLTPSPGTPAAAALGSDLDPGALEAARHNAKNAGLTSHIQWRQGDFEAVAGEVPRGAMVVSNPPYGHRLGGQGQLARTFRRLGLLLRRRADLDPVVLLWGHPDLPRAGGLRWRAITSLHNRGLAVKLLRLERG